MRSVRGRRSHLCARPDVQTQSWVVVPVDVCVSVARPPSICPGVSPAPRIHICAAPHAPDATPSGTPACIAPGRPAAASLGRAAGRARSCPAPCGEPLERDRSRRRRRGGGGRASIGCISSRCGSDGGPQVRRDRRRFRRFIQRDALAAHRAAGHAGRFRQSWQRRGRAWRGRGRAWRGRVGRGARGPWRGRGGRGGRMGERRTIRASSVVGPVPPKICY